MRLPQGVARAVSDFLTGFSFRTGGCSKTDSYLERVTARNGSSLEEGNSCLPLKAAFPCPPNLDIDSKLKYISILYTSYTCIYYSEFYCRYL